jgi:hypothetical protein
MLEHDLGAAASDLRTRARTSSVKWLSVVGAELASLLELRRCPT